ncbi:MAG: ABC transporter ATP-binding protein [Bacteroidales bacterium]|nr:ABC transporter ATP-binding protein [Bacteroidales bacterium]
MFEIKELEFSYKKHRKFFSGINLQLEAGRIYGLLGKNGAGKSTLLKIMSGLLYPKSGTCSISQVSSAERNVRFLQDIFIIPEEFEMPSIKMNQFVSVNSVFYPRFDNAQFQKYLAEFELQGNEMLQSLSFGQRKKFFIAFALATNTRIVLMDEPTNGLDIPSKSQFRKIVTSALDDNRIFLISTHQVRDLSQLIDHIIVLDNGSILFSHSTYSISEALTFCHVKDELNDKVLYKEQVLGGFSAVCKKSVDDIETEIDTELLFNAIIANHMILNDVLRKW